MSATLSSSIADLEAMVRQTMADDGYDAPTTELVVGRLRQRLSERGIQAPLTQPTPQSPPAQPVQDANEPGFFSRMGAGFARGAVNLPASLMDAAVPVARALGGQLNTGEYIKRPLDPVTVETISQFAGDVRTGAGVVRRNLGIPESRGTFADTIGESIPQLGAAVLAGAATGGLGTAPSLAAFAGTSLAPVVGDTYRAAKTELDAAGDPESERKATEEAMIAGTITGATSLLPGVAILRRVPGGDALVRRAASRVALRLAGAATAEGLQEHMEGFGQELATEMVRHDRRLTPEMAYAALSNPQRAQEFFAGALLGGAAHVPFEVAGLASNRGMPNQQDLPSTGPLPRDPQTPGVPPENPTTITPFPGTVGGPPVDVPEQTAQVVPRETPTTPADAEKADRLAALYAQLQVEEDPAKSDAIASEMDRLMGEGGGASPEGQTPADVQAPRDLGGGAVAPEAVPVAPLAQENVEVGQERRVGGLEPDADRVAGEVGPPAGGEPRGDGAGAVQAGNPTPDDLRTLMTEKPSDSVRTPGEALPPEPSRAVPTDQPRTENTNAYQEGQGQGRQGLLTEKGAADAAPDYSTKPKWTEYKGFQFDSFGIPRNAATYHDPGGPSTPIAFQTKQMAERSHRKLAGPQRETSEVVEAPDGKWYIAGSGGRVSPDYSSMTIAQLRDEARARVVEATGTRAVLLDRLSKSAPPDSAPVSPSESQSRTRPGSPAAGATAPQSASESRPAKPAKSGRAAAAGESQRTDLQGSAASPSSSPPNSTPREASKNKRPPIAARMKDGTVLLDSAANMHSELADRADFPHDDIADWGFVINGKYKPESAEAARQHGEEPVTKRPKSGRVVELQGSKSVLESLARPAPKADGEGVAGVGQTFYSGDYVEATTEGGGKFTGDVTATGYVIPDGAKNPIPATPTKLIRGGVKRRQAEVAAKAKAESDRNTAIAKAESAKRIAEADAAKAGVGQSRKGKKLETPVSKSTLLNKIGDEIPEYVLSPKSRVGQKARRPVGDVLLGVADGEGNVSQQTRMLALLGHIEKNGDLRGIELSAVRAGDLKPGDTWRLDDEWSGRVSEVSKDGVRVELTNGRGTIPIGDGTFTTPEPKVFTLNHDDLVPANRGSVKRGTPAAYESKALRETQRDLLGQPVAERLTGSETRGMFGDMRPDDVAPSTDDATDAKIRAKFDENATPAIPSLESALEANIAAAKIRIAKRNIPRGKGKGRSGATTIPGDLIDHVAILANKMALAGVKTFKAAADVVKSYIAVEAPDMASRANLMARRAYAIVRKATVDGKVDPSKLITETAVDKAVSINAREAAVGMEALAVKLREQAKTREKNIDGIRAEFVRLARANVPLPVRGKLLGAVANAKTYGTLAQGIARARKVLIEYEARQALARVKADTRPSKLTKLTNDLRRRIVGQAKASAEGATGLFETARLAYDTAMDKTATPDARETALRELLHARDTIQEAIHAHQTENKVRKRDQWLDATLLKAKLQAQIRRARDPIPDPEPGEKKKPGVWRRLRNWSSGTENFAMSIDGGWDGNGEAVKLLHDISKARSRKDTIVADTLEAADKALRSSGFAGGLPELVALATGSQGKASQKFVEVPNPVLGRKKMTLDEALKWAARDEATLLQFFKNKRTINWDNDRNGQSMEFTEENLRDVKRELDARELMAIDVLKAIRETLKPEAFKVHREIKGSEPIDEGPNYDGRRTNPEKSPPLPELDNYTAEVDRLLEDLHFLKPRSETANVPLLATGFVADWLRSIDQMASVIALAHPIRNARMVLLDRGSTQEAIAARLGDGAIDRIKLILKEASGLNDPPTDAMTRWMNATASRVSRGLVAVNSRSHLLQLGGFAKAAAETDGPVLRRGIARMFTKGLWERARKNSGYTRHRYGLSSAALAMGLPTDTTMRESAGMAFKAFGKSLATGHVRDAFGKNLDALVDQIRIAQWADSLIARALWAGYEVDPRGKDNPEWVAEQMETVMRRTQNPSDYLDATGLIQASKNKFWKSFLAFTGDASKNLDMIERGFGQSQTKGWKAVAGVAGNMLWGAGVRLATGGGLYALAASIGGDEKEEEKRKGRLAEDAVWSLIHDIGGSVHPVADRLVTVAEGTTRAFASPDEALDSAALSTMKDGLFGLQGSVRNLYTAIMSESPSKREKALSQFWKNVGDAAAAGAVLRGIPGATEARKWVKAAKLAMED